MNDNTYSFKISVVFDNKCKKEGFSTGFGFSALVYNNFSKSNILFDTGGNGRVLVSNLQKLNITPKDIKKVVISHNHHDHAGGLDRIYKGNPDIEIYVPNKNFGTYKEHFSNSRVTGVSDLQEIDSYIYSPGEFGSFIREQALYLKTKNDKIVILVGCTHPGLEKFIIKAREMADIQAVIGGFHGFRKFSYLKGIDFIGACHCTSYMNEIRNRFPKQFKKICVGSSFQF
ncbi:MAG: MBL fold metallo-hydrolase [Candidatus Lokiarchaeota archaeon]|nr:MBL fold metallo-hydrolase [Candidatus Lokiarchaeota archaeon]